MNSIHTCNAEGDVIGKRAIKQEFTDAIVAVTTFLDLVAKK